MPSPDAGSLAEFFAMSADALCILDARGRFVVLNTAWERMLGYSLEELRAMQFIDLVHPEDLEQALDATRSPTQDPTPFEIRCLRKDGAVVSLRWTVWLGREDARRHAVVRDITEERHLEAALRTEKSFNKNLLDKAPVFVAAIDGEGKTVTVNGSMLAKLGYRREDVIGGDYLSTFVPERDREGVGRLYAQLIQRHEPVVSESWIQAKDGKEYLVEWHGRARLLPNGKLDHFFFVGIEVSERRVLKDALQRSEQKLALHFQQTPVGFVEWNLDFEISEWNPAAERIFGYSRSEAIGRHGVGFILTESMREQLDHVWRALLEQRGGTYSTNENLTKSGNIIVCDWYNTPLIDAGGRVIGVASLVADVTEEKKAEDALRRRERLQAETIQRLSTPVIEVWQGILTLPIIGVVDSARAAQMTENLLAAIDRTRASFAIVDLTGMDGVDTATADHLLRMVRTTQLLGSQCLISGISPSIAQTLTQLEVGGRELTTFSTLRSALRFALSRATQAGRRV